MLQFDVRNDRFGETTSRRQMLRRLAGLGLVAAGATALRPVAAAAVRDPGDVRPPAGDPPVLDPGPTPVGSRIIEANLEISIRGRAAIVRVSASIFLSDEDLQAMRQGQRSRIACEIWENDNNNPRPEHGFDQFAFAFRSQRIARVTNPSAHPVHFETQVAPSVLDLDTPNPADDEIVGLLILTTPSGEMPPRATNHVKRDFGR
jgi:hypothetical protein